MGFLPGNKIGRQFQKGHKGAGCPGAKRAPQRLRLEFLSKRASQLEPLTDAQMIELRDCWFEQAKIDAGFAKLLIQQFAPRKRMEFDMAAIPLDTLADVKGAMGTLVNCVRRRKVSIEDSRELERMYVTQASLIEKEGIDDLKAFKEDLESKISS